MDFTITHCDPQLAGRLHAALQDKGFSTSETELGKLLVVAVVTDPYFTNPERVQQLREAVQAGARIQPVVHAKDKTRIGELLATAPDDLKSLGDIKWIVLDEDFWEEGVHQILRRLGPDTAVRNEPGSWDIFLGHSRRSSEATTMAAALDGLFTDEDYGVWLDVKMKDCSTAAMKEGVKHSKLFIALVTGPIVNKDRPDDDPVNNAYFKRWFCLEELRWAIDAGILIQPVIRMEDADRKDEFLALAPEDIREVLRTKDWIVWNKESFPKLLRHLPNRQHLKGLRSVLHPLSSLTEVNEGVKRFHVGTREWAFRKFDDWVQTQLDSKVYVLSGGAGVGKTGIMSMLAQKSEVIAVHFCRHDDSDKRSPARAICSIAYQLAEALPAYREMILSVAVDEQTIPDLFRMLLKNPLSKLAYEGPRRVILIDALDECEHNGRNEFLQCIREHFLELPAWLALFMTTRPEVNIMRPLSKFKPVSLEADSDENMADLTIYIRDTLQGRLPDADVDAGTKVLVDKSGGVFIYARYAVERLQMQKHVTLAELDDFPDGLADFYGDQFKRMLEISGPSPAPMEITSALDDAFDVYLGQSTATTLVETLLNSVVVENHLCVCDERTQAGMKRSKLFVVVITEDLDVTEWEWAKECGVPIQPVVRAEDAGKQELRERWDPQHWIKMDRNDIDFWNAGMERLLRSTALDKLSLILQPLPTPAVSQWHDGTRKWVRKRFDDWVQNRTSKVLMLAGEKGIGKTTIAGMLATSVIAYQQLDHAEDAIRSIAYQIAAKIPEYRKRLMALKPDRNKNATALFHRLLKPLSTIRYQGPRQVILLDGVDKCDSDMIACIRDHFGELPDWLGVFLTTRPVPRVLKPLRKYDLFVVEADSDDNKADIIRYLEDQLGDRVPVKIPLLLEKCKGIFQHAEEMVRQLKEGIDVNALPEWDAGSEEERPILSSVRWRVVEAVITACEPLHQESLDALLGCTPDERKEAVEQLSSLFPTRDNKLYVYHKSVKDWLVDAQREDEMWYVDVPQVHARIGRKCTDLWTTSEYALKHGVAHLCAGGLSTLARDLMFVFECYIYEGRTVVTFSFYGVILYGPLYV
eukprot:Stramenopile-MAST_4_protein_2890